MESIAELHPQIVHFPIALLSVYVLLEITAVFVKQDFISKAAYILLLLGVLGALAAVITGNEAEKVAELWEEKGAIIPFGTITDHEDYATITLWYFTALLVLRTLLVIKKKFTGVLKYAVVVLAIVGGYFIYETGEHGGELVHKFGVGTEYFKINEGVE